MRDLTRELFTDFKLATFSNLAQCVGTVSKSLNSCVVMDLAFC